MHLIPLVQYRSFGIMTHTRSSHFMYRHSRSRTIVVSCYILNARCFQHFCSIIHHIYTHLLLIFFKLTIDRQNRLSPFVLFTFIDKYPVFKIRKRFSKTAQAHGPCTRCGHLFFKVCAESHFSNIGMPVATVGTSLISKTPHIVTFVIAHVAVSRYIDSVGPAAISIFVFKSFSPARSSATEMMVHQVVTQLSASIAKSVRMLVGNRVK